MSMSERADDGVAPTQVSRHAGYPVPSDTYNGSDQGTDWREDAFTSMIMGPHDEAAYTPADHSYDQDGNMEAYEIAGPYVADNEANQDVGRFTGATGPTGHVTPPGQPEVTAP